MSAGTSKLHHYAYPFLPPLALAGGYAAAWILKLSQPWAAALVRATRLRESPSGRTLRHALLLLAAVAMLVAVATLVLGRLHLRIGDVTVFRNSNVHRPLLVAVVLGAIAGRAGLPLMLLIIAPPLLAYRGTIDRLTIERHPLRTVRDCLVTVNDGLLADGKGSRGVYVVMPERWLFHSYFYYLRSVGPLERGDGFDEPAILRRLSGADAGPVMIPRSAYDTLRARGTEAVASVGLGELLVLLPGRYGACEGQGGGLQ